MKETIELLNPIEFHGQTITGIELDFEMLTGEVLIRIDREFMAADRMNEAVNIREYSKEYQILTASHLSGLPMEFYHNIKARDFSAITTRVQHFFIGIDS
ncbi:hypothetical protein BVG16_16345 [Paenibacillus selenitireducens]|uniref:Phage tail assembly protein n=1 Tax=Paenibacillus selenitireducens TaxID=1324314 RepID=A0A1T2XA74_9BACL|nr:phage tail assembly protein [Paenibacillus selenitireducens]OPA76740.1 hypothetical protein BVG16_16345 [Paenibacillus selenitireducens]